MCGGGGVEVKDKNKKNNLDIKNRNYFKVLFVSLYELNHVLIMLYLLPFTYDIIAIYFGPVQSH